MNPSALADLIDQFVHRVDTFLLAEDDEKLAWENIPLFWGTEDAFCETDAAHEKRTNAEDAMRDVGRRLAAELVAACRDAKPVLHLLHCIDRGGGAVRTLEPLWPQTKVDLQQLALQLQTGDAGSAETHVAASTPPDTEIEPPDSVHPDGPEGGNCFWWKGKQHPIKGARRYKLLVFMWKREHADFDALIDDLFGETVGANGVKTAVCRLNNDIKGVLPWRLTVSTVNRIVRKEPA